jgi:putative transcriptional regulator
MSKTNLIRSFAIALCMAVSADLAQAQDLACTVVLVAKPELRADPVFGASIIVATWIGGEQHLGFIVNRPTSVTGAAMFPGDGAAQKLVDPVYLGGPVGSEAVYALVRSSDGPGKGSMQLLPGVFLAISEQAVDRALAAEPERTRLMAGLVAWKPGELEQEIKRGYWYVLEPEVSLVLPRNPEGLWEELARRSRLLAEAI